MKALCKTIFVFHSTIFVLLLGSIYLFPLLILYSIHWNLTIHIRVLFNDINTTKPAGASTQQHSSNVNIIFLINNSNNIISPLFLIQFNVINLLIINDRICLRLSFFFRIRNNIIDSWIVYEISPFSLVLVLN